VTRRGVLLAVLVYVALDLSLPGMPGAFVFDTAESVESAQGARARGAGALAAEPTAAARISASQPQIPDPPRRLLAAAVPRASEPPRDASRLPCGAAGSAPSASPSEDPH
jgi:hypothetical protein